MPEVSSLLSTLSCPACESGRLVLTKEMIVLCQSCLNGYRMVGDVPDLRLAHAIPFKKHVEDGCKKGIHVVLTVLIGENKNASFEVPMDHCIVVGRQVSQDFKFEHTQVFQLAEVAERPVRTSFVHIDSNTQKLVDQILSKSGKKTVFSVQQPGMTSQIGGFQRDADFLVKDVSVSKAHALFYQNSEGIQIIDLLSKNGTFVNGHEVESIKLKNHDVISLGTLSLRVNIYS